MNDELVEAIRRNLEEIDSNAVDTVPVKTALCEACKTINRVFAYSSKVERPPADGGEWLFDVTGLLYDDDGYLRRTVLVAESEWGPWKEIYSDFEKLLTARADVRVMVFDGGQNPGYREIFETFATYIARCEQSQAGDIWLFAAWTPDRFHFHRIDAFQSQRDLE